MKNLLLAVLAFAITFTSCKSDDPAIVTNPKVSFADSNFDVPKGCTQKVRLLLEKAFENETRIPVTFSGTAIEGTDFKAIADKSFLIPAGAKEAILEVQVLPNISESKDIIISLDAIPLGYEAGRFIKTKITTTLEATTIFSFLLPTAELIANYLPIEVNLFNQVGGEHKVPTKTELAIEVDKSSTAVLGTHFKFKNDQIFASIPANKSRGNVEIEFLKWEEGKDMIVLACGEPSGYFDGTNPLIKVMIKRPIAKSIVGEWKGLAPYKLSDMGIMYGLSEQEIAKLPTCTATDLINFKADGTMSVSMTGKLKNYFRNSSWKVEGSDLIYLSTAVPPEKIIAPRVVLGTVNADFSDKSETLGERSVSAFIKTTSDHPEILVIRIFGTYDTPSGFTYSGEKQGFDLYGEGMVFQFIRK